MAWRIGVNSGGTFTDICLFDEATGRIAVWKVSSTPVDPSEAVAKGVGKGLAEIALGDVAYFGHGTTVATNALIQHRGARVGLAGDEMRLHFESPLQVRAGINMIYTALLSSVYFAAKAVIDPTILLNSGLARPLTVTAPPGTIFIRPTRQPFGLPPAAVSGAARLLPCAGERSTSPVDV